MLEKTTQIFKKLVYAGIVASVLLAGAAGKATSAPDSNSIVVDDVEFYIETDKSIYYLGENVQMLYRLTKLGFPSATIPYYQAPPLNLVVLKDGKTVWMKVQYFWQIIGDLQLFPRIPVEITSCWDMNDLNNVLVEPGIYDVLGVIYTGLEIPDVGVRITILPVPRTITVGLGAGYDFNTIQAAIDDSNDDDTIIVQPGIYIENINFIGKNITLRSTEPTNPGAVASTVIDGSLSGSVVTFAGTESPACVLSGFTITNGSGPVATVVGYNCGGGIYGNGTLATIQYNIISGNWATSPIMPHCGYGGGIYDCDGIIRYNVISENKATCNEGTASGGGIYGCDGIINNNIISGNSADGFSGGHDIEGGGLSNCNGTIHNNVVSGNHAGGWSGVGKGGGLSNCNGTIRNCIIWQNIADQGAQIYASSTPSYSCIENWLGGGDGNIDLDPRFVGSGYWDICGLPPHDYPCWVETGDYHLRSLAGRWDPDGQTWAFDFETSPCIDTGDPKSPIGHETFPNGGIINMGAYGGTAQASKSYFGTPLCETIVAGDINGDCIVNFKDFALMAFHWLRDENN